MPELVRVQDEDWSIFLSKSPQRTRFLEPAFLSIFECPVRFYFWIEKGVPAIGIPVIDSSKWGDRVLPMCYYQGPVFNSEIFKGKMFNIIQNEINFIQKGITSLCKIEKRFNFSLHTSITDVRGFDWVHYNDEGLNRLEINPRYTAIFDLKNQTKDSIRSFGRSVRRQEERYAEDREKLSARENGSIEILMELYKKTYAKQNITVKETEIELLRKYLAYFIDKGYGYIIEVFNKSDETLASGFVFEDHFKTWHVPIVGVGGTRFGGTLLYYSMLDFALSKGAKALDFNGANSPNRGYFKHSIGAHAQLYFEVDYVS